MKGIIVGMDLAKNDVYMYAINSDGQTIFDRKVKKDKISEKLAEINAEIVLMEACGGSHHLARQLRALKYDVKMIAPQHVKPFVSTHKNDRNDARAIIEAGRRIGAVFVAIKEPWQQDIQVLHRIKERLIKNRVALSNQIRGILMEYGFLIPKGKANVEPYVLEYLTDESGKLSDFIKEEVHNLYDDLLIIKARTKDVESKILKESKQREDCQKLEKLKGVGPVISTAFIASIGDPKVFKNGRQVSAWLGLVPRQSSTGGKTKLLGISKSGDSYLRKMIIQGARSQVVACMRKEYKSPVEEKIVNMIENKGFNKTAVALANKNARKMWAILAS